MSLKELKSKIEDAAKEAHQNSDHWFRVEKDFDSAARLDIKAKTLDDVVALLGQVTSL